MIRPRTIVAEYFGSITAEKNCACMPYGRQQLTRVFDRQFEMLWGDEINQIHRLVQITNLDKCASIAQRLSDYLAAIEIRNRIARITALLILTVTIHGGFVLFTLIAVAVNASGRKWAITKDLFRFKGRVARGVFLSVTLMTSAVAYSLLFLIDQASFAWPFYIPGVLVYVLAGLVQTFNIIRRFHDLGRPGTGFWLLFIPVYNLYITWLLLTRRGPEEDNEYGVNPLSKNKA